MFKTAIIVSQKSKFCSQKQGIDRLFPLVNAMKEGDYIVYRYFIYRGSYMNAHVLLNLLNQLGEKIRCDAFPSILSVFSNEFNKFNNTGARMQDSIYHMTLNRIFFFFFFFLQILHQNIAVSPLENTFFLWKSYDVICTFNQLVDYCFKCIASLHSQMRRHMINLYIYEHGYVSFYAYMHSLAPSPSRNTSHENKCCWSHRGKASSKLSTCYHQQSSRIYL